MFVTLPFEALPTHDRAFFAALAEMKELAPPLPGDKTRALSLPGDKTQAVSCFVKRRA